MHDLNSSQSWGTSMPQLETGYVKTENRRHKSIKLYFSLEYVHFLNVSLMVLYNRQALMFTFSSTNQLLQNLSCRMRHCLLIKMFLCISSNIHHTNNIMRNTTVGKHRLKAGIVKPKRCYGINTRFPQQRISTQ
jgi:hypothetical protein